MPRQHEDNTKSSMTSLAKPPNLLLSTESRQVLRWASERLALFYILNKLAISHANNLKRCRVLSFKRVAASSQGQRIRANSTLKTTTSSGAGPPYEFLSATPPLQTSQIITRNPPQKVYFDRPDIAVLLPSFIPLYLGNWFRQLGRWCWQASCRKLCSPQQQSRAGRAVQGLGCSWYMTQITHGSWLPHEWVMQSFWVRCWEELAGAQEAMPLAIFKAATALVFSLSIWQPARPKLY